MERNYKGKQECKSSSGDNDDEWLDSCGELI